MRARRIAAEQMEGIRSERKKRKYEIAGCQKCIERRGGIASRIVVLNRGRKIPEAFEPARGPPRHNRSCPPCCPPGLLHRESAASPEIRRFESADRRPSRCAPSRACNARASSAVGSVNRSGTTVNQMPRRVHASTSKLSQPLSAPATIFRFGTRSQEFLIQRIGHEDHQRVRVALPAGR